MSMPSHTPRERRHSRCNRDRRPRIIPGRRWAARLWCNIAACARAGRRSLVCGGGRRVRRRRRSRAQPRDQPPAPTAARRSRAALAAQRQLRHQRPPRSGAAGRSRATSCSRGATSPTTPTRTLRFHLYYNAWRNTGSTWMRERRLAGDTGAGRSGRSRLGLDRHHQPARDCAPTARRPTSRRACASSRRTTATRTIGRWRRCRSAAPVQPGQTVNVQIAWSSRVPRTFARTGVDRRLLLPRAVVPEDRRARGRRLELPPVPRRHRVLLRLRRLRRRG